MHPGFQPVALPRARSRPPLVSLLAPAIVVALVVAANIALNVSFLVNTRRAQVMVNTLFAGHSVNVEKFGDTAHRHHLLLVSTGIAAAVLVATLMLWTAGALVNDGRTQPGSSGSPWALLSWVVPPLFLAAPPWMWSRIRTGQRLALPARQRPRGNYELIALWWILTLTVLALHVFTWIDGAILLAKDPGLVSDQFDHLRTVLRVRLILGGVTIAASVAALACVVMITRTNERLRKSPEVAEVELPGPGVTPIPIRPNVASSYPSSIFPVAVHPSDPRWKPVQPPPDAPPTTERGYWG